MKQRRTTLCSISHMCKERMTNLKPLRTCNPSLRSVSRNLMVVLLAACTIWHCPHQFILRYGDSTSPNAMAGHSSCRTLHMHEAHWNDKTLAGLEWDHARYFSVLGLGTMICWGAFMTSFCTIVVRILVWWFPSQLQHDPPPEPLRIA